MKLIRFLAALAPLACIVNTAAANADPRLNERMFVADQIVTIKAKPGIESAVAFDPDERIENIAIGNSTTWEVSPNKRANVIFVKPATLRARTNMTVITDRRTYLFDLVSSTSAPVYMMRFRYPDAPKHTSVTTAQVVPTAPAAAVEAPPQSAPQPVPVTLNFAWRGAGDKKLLPASYFDDGSSTFLHWPGDTSLPAILARGSDGMEGPVNYTVKGDYIVVEGIPAQLVLRSGKEVATLTPIKRPVTPPKGNVSTWTLRPQSSAVRSGQ